MDGLKEMLSKVFIMSGAFGFLMTVVVFIRGLTLESKKDSTNMYMLGGYFFGAFVLSIILGAIVEGSRKKSAEEEKDQYVL